MFVVLSRFAVANGTEMTAATKAAFVARPHQVDAAAGFVRLEVLSPLDTPTDIWLFTYWHDEASFRLWYRSHQYYTVHEMMPEGLKLDPAQTYLQFFEYVGS